MHDVNSIVGYLEKNATEKPDQIAYEFVTDLDLSTQTITYGQLYQDVSSIAKNLLGKVAQGNSVLLLYPPGIEYIKAFFACVMAGVVAIPLYPPKKNSKSDKVFVVAKASGAQYALTTKGEIDAISQFWQANAAVDMQFVSTEQLIAACANEDVELPAINPEKPAFLQYTSGSTGDPKGVIITQGNILANTRYLQGISGAHDKDIFVNWLPLFHDLGLVTAILLPAYIGSKSVLIAPANFVRHPAIWLKAMTRFKGTLGGAPNFAFDLCTDKVSEAELEGVDLSNWRVAYNAAEPVNNETINRFAERFAAVGFRRDAFYPSYGMAESTAFISGGHADDKVEVISISKKALAENKVVMTADDDMDKIDFVGNGLTDQDHHLRIVDAQTKNTLADGEIGQVWFAGPSVSPGYWLLDEVSKQTFGNKLSDEPDRNYLQTGDLGFILNNHIYITGRSKDMLILNGKNYYPQDIEATIKYCHSALHPGFAAVFESEGKLVIVTEVNRQALKSLNAQAVAQEIARNVYAEHSISVDDVVLLRPYQIPMTSSGKIRRAQTKKLYQQGLLVSLYNKISRDTVEKPKSEVESQLHDIWSSVLDMPEICVNRGFFELGGDSIKAVEIASKVGKQFAHLKLDENQLLECVSIKEMAQLVTLNLVKNTQTSNTSGAIRI